MNNNILLQFKDYLQNGKIKLTDEAGDINVDYDLTNEELNDFIKLDGKEPSDDPTADFRQTIETIIQQLIAFSKLHEDKGNSPDTKVST